MKKFNKSLSVKSILRLTRYAVLLVALVGTQLGAHEPTIAKREATDVARRVTGYVIRTRGRSEIVALSLPSMAETIVRGVTDGGSSQPVIHAISGPDHRGRIAFIEDYPFVQDAKGQKHRFKTIQVDGTSDVEVFSRPGGALWAVSRAGRGEIGTYLALAPSGGRVAFLSGLAERQMPSALLHEGSVEIWDIDKKEKLGVTVKAINQPMSWFPDGKRLAYVKVVPREELPPETLGLTAFGKYFGETWKEVPAIFVLDIESTKSTLLHVGWTPVVACDGKSIMVGGWDHRSQFSWSCFRFEDRKSSPVKWPDDAGGAVAVPENNVVLYKGLQTGGNSLDHPKLVLSLKLARIDTGEFQTLVSKFDPHDVVSFGRITGSPK